MISLPFNRSFSAQVTARLLSSGTSLRSSSWQHLSPTEEFAMPYVPLQSLTAFFKSPKHLLCKKVPSLLVFGRCSGTHHAIDSRFSWTNHFPPFSNEGSLGCFSTGGGLNLCLPHLANFCRTRQPAFLDLRTSPCFLSHGHCLLQTPFFPMPSICSLQGLGAERHWVPWDDLNKIPFRCPSLQPFFLLFFYLNG